MEERTLSCLYSQTTKEILRKEGQMDKFGIKVKVVEKGGRSLKRMLQCTDVEPSTMCNHDDCVCRTEAKEKCSMENVGYIWCKEFEQRGVDCYAWGVREMC